MNAAVLSPLLSRNGLHLALGAGVFTLLGWAFWRWELHAGRTMPNGQAQAAALEPTDRL